MEGAPSTCCQRRTTGALRRSGEARLSQAAAIVFTDVVKRYRGRVALGGLSFAVPRGAVFGLLGPNGAGKTTTLRLITGVLGADSGQVHVLGAPAGSVGMRIGFLPEEKGLYRRMRVLEFLVFFARLKGLSRRSARKCAGQMLEQFGIADRARQRCDELSKGLGQKLQLAVALVHDPELLILDEPFSGLDPVNVDLVRTIVKEKRARGHTVLLSTHDMAQAELLCDELLLLNRGVAVLAGDTQGILGAGPPTLRLDYVGAAPDFAAISGVVAVRDTGRHAELQLTPGADPQQVLAALLNATSSKKVSIERFDTRNASLHEIFLNHVGATQHAGDTGAESAA